MSPESPAPREPGIQMTGALCLRIRGMNTESGRIYLSSEATGTARAVNRLTILPTVKTMTTPMRPKYMYEMEKRTAKSDFSSGVELDVSTVDNTETSLLLM